MSFPPFPPLPLMARLRRLLGALRADRGILGRLRAEHGILGRLRADSGGNVMMITALIIVPLIFATGFGIDYSRAQKLQTKLNTAADAAVLAAVVPQMLNQTDATAKLAAQAMFDQQIAGLSGLGNVSRTVTITSTQTGSLARCAPPSWSTPPPPPMCSAAFCACPPCPSAAMPAPAPPSRPASISTSRWTPRPRCCCPPPPRASTI
jgi:Flp pilus assembly protein TadG